MNRSVIPLFLLVLVAAIAVVALQWEQNTVVEQDDILLNGFAAQAENLSAVELRNAQGVLINVKKDGANWRAMLAEPGVAYPVDEEQLADMVQALKSAKKLEAKTKNADKYDRLGVSDISATDSQATLVTLTASEQTWQVLVGKAASSGLGSYVRLPQDTQSWLSDTALGMPDAVEDWLQQPILDLDEETVVSMTKLGEAGWTVQKSEPEQANFALQAMPEGRELKYAGVLDGVVSSLLSMRFDAIGSDAVLTSESEAVAQFRLNLKDGLQVLVALYAVAEDHYVRFSAPESGAYWQGQLYKVSSFSAGQINKSVEDFLADLPSEDVAEPVAQDEGQSPGN